MNSTWRPIEGSDCACHCGLIARATSLPRHLGAPPENREYPDFSIKKIRPRFAAGARPFLLANQEDSLPDTAIRHEPPQSECGDTFNSELNGLIFAALTMAASSQDCAKAHLCLSLYIVKQQEAQIAKASLASHY